MRYLLIFLLLFAVAYGEDAYIGYNLSTPTTSGFGAANIICWTPFESPATGVIDTIYARYTLYNFIDKHFVAAVYNSDGTSLLGYQEITLTTSSASYQWVKVPFSSPVAVTEGTTYVLASWSESGPLINLARYYDSTGMVRYTDNETYDGTPPASLTNDTETSNSIMVIYGHIVVGSAENNAIHEKGQTVSPIHGKGEVCRAYHSK